MEPLIFILLSVVFLPTVIWGILKAVEFLLGQEPKEETPDEDTHDEFDGNHFKR